VIVSVFVVPLCRVRVMRSFFVGAGVMMLCRFAMMSSRVPVVFRRFTMMIGSLFRH
jgi:hypothetical protein